MNTLLPLRISMQVVSYKGKNVYMMLVNCLERLPRHIVVKYLTYAVCHV